MSHPLVGWRSSDQDGWGLRSNLICRGIFEDFHAGSKGNLYSKIATPRAATNRNLSQEVAAGRFREDLYYRLNVFPIQIPPLRDRREDIPKLVETFIQEFAKTMDKAIDGVAKTSLQTLCGYDWPGNIRELRNVIERAVILANGPILKIALPTDELATAMPPKSPQASLAKVERDHIVQVLEACGWRVRGLGGAAAILGLNPSTLESRMNKLGIRRPSSL